MNINITTVLKQVGHIDVNVKKYNEGDKAEIQAELFDEILSLINENNFTLSIDVYQEMKKGAGA